MPLPVTLEPGPVYFFDQLISRTKERGKKGLPTDFNSHTINSHPTSFIPSLHKCSNPGCKGKHVEENEDSFLKEDTTRGENYPFLLQTSSSSLFKTISEVPSSKFSPKPSILPAEEEIQMSLLAEYKSMAPTILHELGEILHLFASYDIIFPQGIVNLLNYSWKELTEGADYSKRHQQSLKDKSTRSGKGQTPEECDKKAPRSEYVDHEMIQCAKGWRKKSVLPTDSGKEKKNPEMAPNNPLGNKAPVVQHDTHLPVTISFSLSSKLSEEKGWSFQHSDSEDLEWKAPFAWAVTRLRQAQIQINNQISKLKEAGFDQPVILRHYGDAVRENIPKKFKERTCKTLFELLNGKPQIPAIKQAVPTLQKLHYRLIDGSSLIYYPSGCPAVCQSYSDLPRGGVYTNIFSASPDQRILGSFTPFGHGSISLHNSNVIAMMFNQEGGMVTNRDGEIVREWRWPQVGKLSDPVVMQVNDYITVRVAGRFAISLVYRWQQERVQLSLSPLQDVALPQLEELGQMLTRVKLSSKSAKEFSKVNRKKLREEETKVSKKKPKLSDLVKTLKNPEETISPINDFSAARELRKLQQKIKNILDDWLEYYRMAFEIDSPHIHKMPRLSQRTLTKCTVQSAAASLTTSVVQRAPEKKRDYRRASESDSPLLLAHFQSASAHKMLWEQSSYSPRISSLANSNIKPDQPHVPQFSLNKYTVALQNAYISGDKLWLTSHSACPAVLRRMLVGQEGKICRCSNHQIPYVSDLEYDHLINNQMSAQEQIMVVCVSSSLKTNEDPSEDKLEQLYERKNRNRSMPCMQEPLPEGHSSCFWEPRKGRLDSYRLLKYDINYTDEFTGHKGSLLVQRHNVAPGMFLMYIQGKLLFANYIFNGYSNSAKDLQKQIAKTRGDYHMGYCIPNDFRFSNGVGKK
nr:uncharacterized protein LOC102456527 isoform X3 [Pelodiscus sinensis]|eukprot:XP_025038012.1 uncharacterized protein LOC102456527 isoform X3 [Pelodiscus sinensis]